MATLVFGDRRRDGAYPVTDSAGVVVARLRVNRAGSSFVAEDATGSTLCTGSSGRWGLSNLWRATGSAGQRLLEVRKNMLRARAAVSLTRGGGMVVEGSVWRRDFQVRDTDRVVLSASPQTSVISPRPYEYAVTQQSDALTLAETVAVVQIWRLLRKRDDASAAAAASTAVIASS